MRFWTVLKDDVFEVGVGERERTGQSRSPRSEIEPGIWQLEELCGSFCIGLQRLSIYRPAAMRQPVTLFKVDSFKRPAPAAPTIAATSE
jgi:hypothetical protein